MTEVSKTKKIEDSPRDRRILDQEMKSREDELESALKLYSSISEKILQSNVMVGQAIFSLEKLQNSCKKSPVLRAAMVSRRLSVQNFERDIKLIYSKSRTAAESINKLGSSRKEELEQIIKDPELLR